MTRFVAAAAVLLALTACETVKGAGQDVQHAGQGIQHSAAETQAQM